MKESSLIEEIMDEGRVEIGQADVLAVLKARFDAQAAASCREAVKRITNLKRLGRLWRLAARCPSVEEFQRGLQLALAAVCPTT